MCGVIGLYGNVDVFRDLYQGLLAIQHRGQDSAGIVTYNGRFHAKKGNGLVQDIFTPENLERLKGSIGICHTRYPRSAAAAATMPSPSWSTRPSGS